MDMSQGVEGICQNIESRYGRALVFTAAYSMLSLLPGMEVLRGIQIRSAYALTVKSLHKFTDKYWLAINPNSSNHFRIPLLLPT